MLKRKPLRRAPADLRDKLLIALAPVALKEFYGDGGAWNDHDDLSEHLYSVIDAMLRARAK